MKRSLLVSLLSLLSGITAWAQPFMVGVKGGVPLTDFVNTVTSSSPSLDSFISTTNRYLVGPTAELDLPFGFGVEFDALYRHFNYSFQDDVTGTGKTTSNAWEFPLLAKYRFPIPGIKPFIDGGVTFDTLSGLKQTLFGASSATSPVELRHNSIWGEAVGGGLDIRLAYVHLLPEIRYTRWNTQHFTTPDDLLHWNQNQAEFLLGIEFGGTPR